MPGRRPRGLHRAGVVLPLTPVLSWWGLLPLQTWKQEGLLGWGKRSELQDSWV